jgi:acyl carrier protein
LTAKPEERLGVVRGIIKEKLGALLGVTADDIEPTNKIVELGVDSLMAIEVKVWLHV